MIKTLHNSRRGYVFDSFKINVRVFLFFLMTMPSFLLAQSNEVTGTVVSANDGTPIPGVNVLLKGQSAGTSTDFDGNFTLNASANDVLVFSFVGFKTQEVTVGNQTTFTIELEEDLAELDAVTVTSIGYGKIQNREITSAVSSVKEEKFNKGNVNDPAQLLQGKVPGLSIVKPGADPNAGFNIRLRGLSTFGANASPLIVIDGVLGGNLQLIDPNDIESIEVLKDASAAAIYGTRGASGVILVTTKRARTNQKPQIDYNSYVAIEEVAQFVRNSTPEQFIEAGGTDGGFRTDWLDLVTQAGVTQVHNLALSNNYTGGNYRASINYRDVEGIAKGSGFDQLNARFNLMQKGFDDKLTLNFNGGVTLRNADFVPYESLRFAIIADPTQPIFLDGDESNGYWEPQNTPEYHNPVAIQNEVTDEGKYKTMLASLRANYAFTDALSLEAFYSLQYESDVRSQYFSSRTRFASSSGLGGRATKFAEDRQNSLFELTANFDKKFGKLKTNILAGYSWQEFTFENFGAFNTNFITDDLLYNSLELGLGSATGNEAFFGLNSQKEESRLISYFGRVVLNYDDTYFLSGTYRREGSSKFGANNRWGNFYAISGGLDFTKVFELPLDNLKLRAGYGVTGNLPNENYAYRTRLTRGSRTLFNESRYLQGVNFASNPNPDLKWEEKAELNIGLDYALLNNRIYGSIDYYSRNTSDVLQYVSVPQPPNLFGSTLLNIGELKSTGLEIGLNGIAVQTENVNYSTGITFSTYETTLEVIDGERDEFFIGNFGPPGLNGVTPIRVAEGAPIGDIYAPIFDGLDDDGNRVLVDQNDDGVITKEEDWVKVGNGLPDFELAWSSNLTYKNFDLSATFRGAFGHSLVNINRAYYESPAITNVYNPVRTKYYLPDLNEGEAWTSYYAEKADFFKLDNITLGYNWNFENTDIRNLRVYVSGQNLFVITGYTGVDPEVHYSYGSPLAPGIDDRNSYFRSRTFTVGLNIGL